MPPPLDVFHLAQLTLQEIPTEFANALLLMLEIQALMNSDAFSEVVLLVQTYNAHEDITAKFPLMEQLQFVLPIPTLKFVE